ncbi:EamA family transporter [Mesorhizobium wenxiniae]|uniref:EamA family transporter n=1 Tax=Mesorhizobium wenxiniae TaxID=2014805 RepID=UPI0013FE4471|nr:EamA family transporter [Mesorhizobium wenxiniae]
MVPPTGAMGEFVLRTELSDIVVPSMMVVLAVTLIPLGAAASHGLFPVFGPLGVLFLRSLMGGALLALLQRKHIIHAIKTDPFAIVAFGLCMAIQNSAFLSAIDRIPLGVAVTIEFMGPIFVAVVGSRRKVEFMWVMLAAAGIALLSPTIGSELDPLGVLLAAVSAVGWAGFIVCSKRLGRTVGRNGALPSAIFISCALLLPFIPADRVSSFVAHPQGLLTMAIVAIFASALPLSLEYRALQTLKARNYGVLVAVEPAVATLIGMTFLGDKISAVGWAAMAAITAASIGTTMTSSKSTPPLTG